MSTSTQTDMHAFIEMEMRTFIAENLTFSENTDEIADTTSLLEEDIIDSTSVLELVMFMEERFNIKVEDAEVVPANLDTIKDLVAYVSTKLPTATDLPALQQLKQSA